MLQYLSVIVIGFFVTSFIEFVVLIPFLRWSMSLHLSQFHNRLSRFIVDAIPVFIVDLMSCWRLSYLAPFLLFYCKLVTVDVAAVFVCIDIYKLHTLLVYIGM